MNSGSKTIKRIKKNLKKAKVININEMNNNIDITNSNYTCDDEMSNDEYVEYEYIDELTNLVKTYTALDDECRNLKKIIENKTKNEKERISKLNKDKKILNDRILIHLEKTGEGHLNLSKGKLIKNTYIKDAPINTDMILNALNESNINNEKIKKNIINSIEKQKKITGSRRTQLKRTFK